MINIMTSLEKTHFSTSGASSLENREQVSQKVLKELNGEMKRLHENEPFHNEEHPEHVLKDANDVLAIFEKYDQITPDDKLAVDTAATGHDLVLNYAIAQRPEAFNYGQRIRYRGFGSFMPPVVKEFGVEKGNEELSWLRVQEIVAKHDPNKKIYTDKILKKVESAIGATYPDVYPATFPENATLITDPETNESMDLAPYLMKDKDGKPMGFKFDQPTLLSNPESDVSTLAVALGDLMYAGKCDGETFKMRGNEEYRETREVIGQELKAGSGSLTPERKAQITKDMIDWIRSQVGFLLWQKVRFVELLNKYKPIAENPRAEEIRKDLAELYNKFDANLSFAKQRTDAAESKYGSLKNPETYTAEPERAASQFNDLLQEMGYTENFIGATQ